MSIHLDLIGHVLNEVNRAKKHFSSNFEFTYHRSKTYLSIELEFEYMSTKQSTRITLDMDDDDPEDFEIQVRDFKKSMSDAIDRAIYSLKHWEPKDDSDEVDEDIPETKDSQPEPRPLP